MDTERTIGPAGNPHNEALMQKILGMTEEELSAIFDESPFYQKKMEQAVKDFQSIQKPIRLAK